MRAVGLTTHGGPEVLEVLDLPDPHAGPGKVRIRVHAATVNPTDLFVRDGRRSQDVPPPWVPGMDVAGVVDEVGGDGGVGGDLRVGDAVMAVVVPKGTRGGYAEYVVLPVESVVRAPAGLDHVHAATVPMNGLTARRALDLLDPGPGTTIGVTGAAGALGGYAVQLAKDRGLQVVADASEADEELVSGLGADVVVRRGDDVAERIRGAVPGGVATLVDGSTQGDRLLPAVADGGRIATVRGYEGPHERGITWHPVWVVAVTRDRDRLDALRVLAESGGLTPRVAATYPVEQAAQAHARLERGGTRGRLVLTL